MSVELTEANLCQTVQEALLSVKGVAALSGPITMASRMGDPVEWDSLSFVAVFMAVGEAFDVDLEDDDAIHFQAMAPMFEFMQEIMDE